MKSKLGNITFDCVDPQKLSWFWADVFGYPRAEWPSELKQQLLESGLSEEDLLSRSIAEDPTGEGPRFFFQRVPEEKVVKNRVHIDVRTYADRQATPDEVDAEATRIVALGASVVRRLDNSWGPFGEYHYILQDPEGNEFCLQ